MNQKILLQCLFLTLFAFGIGLLGATSVQAVSTLPDYVIDSIRLNPSIPIAQSPADVYVVVRNIGGSATGVDASVSIEVVDGPSETAQKLVYPIDSSDWLSGVTREKKVGAMNFSSDGIKGLHVLVTTRGTELDTTNNEKTALLFVGGENLQPDFEISSVRFDPAIATVGESVVAYVSIVNRGDAYQGYWQNVTVNGSYTVNSTSKSFDGVLQFSDWGKGETKEVAMKALELDVIGGISINLKLNSDLMERNSLNNSSVATLNIREGEGVNVDASTSSNTELPLPPDENIIEPQLSRPTKKSYDLRRAHGDTRVYRIVQGHRIWIPTAEVFNSQRLDWGAIRDTLRSEVDSVPLANLIRTVGDMKVYLVAENGYKRHVPNPSVFESYGYKWGDVLDVENSIVDAFPVNVLIRKSGDERVYKLENGRKRWIKTAQAFAKQNFKWQDIGLVNEAELNSYPDGSPIE